MMDSGLSGELKSKESNGSTDDTSGLLPRRPRPKKALTSKFLDEGEGEQVVGTGKSRWSCCDWLLGTSRGQWFSLIVIGILLILLGVAFWSLTGGNGDYDSSFTHSLWISWGLFFDPGTQTGIPPGDPLKVKAVAVIFSTLGFIFNLSLLGLIVDFIRNHLEYWRAQRSRIVQNNHTLIVGLSERTVLLLHELLIAYEHKKDARNASRPVSCCCRCCPGRWRRCRKSCRKRRAVVILADMEEYEMETMVMAHLNEHDDVSTENIHFRRGDPQDWRELCKVSPSAADDIIVVGKGSGSPHESDQEVLRIILALATLPKGHQVSGEVFAEMRISENIHTVCAVLPKANGINSRPAVNRMFCLMGMDPAVGCCMVDLASFKSGDQLFILRCPPALWDLTFEEACYFFPFAILIGVKMKEARHMGIQHPKGQKLKDGDRLVLLSTTHERAATMGPGQVTTDASQKGSRLGEVTPPLSPRNHREVICMIGCPADYTDLLRCINMSVPPRTKAAPEPAGAPADAEEWAVPKGAGAKGSWTERSRDHEPHEVHIISENRIDWREDMESNAFNDGLMDNSTNNLQVFHYMGPTSSRRHLSQLPLARATAVLIMAECQVEGEDASAPDSRNLNSVVALRRCDPGPPPDCNVICELQDSRSETVVLYNQSLSSLCSYFHSNSLETAMFAMAAEDRAVFNSLLELLTPGRGAQINGIPVRKLCKEVEFLNFWQLHTKVLQCFGSILIGWHREDGHKKAGIEVQLNPEFKDEPLRWDPSKNQHLLVVVRPPVSYSNVPDRAPDLSEEDLVDHRDAPPDGATQRLPGQVQADSPSP